MGDPSSDQLGNRQLSRFADEIVKRHLDRAIDSLDLLLATERLGEVDSQGVGIGKHAAFEERSNPGFDNSPSLLAPLTRSISDHPVVRFHANHHAVPFPPAPFPAA